MHSGQAALLLYVFAVARFNTVPVQAIDPASDECSGSIIWDHKNDPKVQNKYTCAEACKHKNDTGKFPVQSVCSAFSCTAANSWSCTCHAARNTNVLKKPDGYIDMSGFFEAWSSPSDGGSSASLLNKLADSLLPTQIIPMVGIGTPPGMGPLRFVDLSTVYKGTEGLASVVNITVRGEMSNTTCELVAVLSGVACPQKSQMNAASCAKCKNGYLQFATSTMLMMNSLACRKWYTYAENIVSTVFSALRSSSVALRVDGCGAHHTAAPTKAPVEAPTPTPPMAASTHTALKPATGSAPAPAPDSGDDDSDGEAPAPAPAACDISDKPSSKWDKEKCITKCHGVCKSTFDKICKLRCSAQCKCNQDKLVEV